MNILNIYKNSVKFYNNQLNKKLKIDYSLTELTDKKVGFLETGTLSSETAKRLKAFSVIYNNLSNYKDCKKLNNIINIDKGY